MTIKTRNFADSSVTSAKLAADAVAGAKFAAASISAASMNADAKYAHPLGNSDGLYAMRVARFTFNPTLTAGDRTIGAHAASVSIPAGAVVAGGFIDIITTFADGVADAATIGVSLVVGGDVVVAIAIADGTNPWDAGRHAIILKANTPEHATAGIKLAAAAAPTFTVGGVALTAGKAVLFLFYSVSSVT